jgi:hypothetical protein
MVVDQIDRDIVSRRNRSRLAPVGRGVSRSGHMAAALIRRIVDFALSLIETIVSAVPGVLRYVVKAAAGLVSWVIDVGAQIVRRAVGILRQKTA